MGPQAKRQQQRSPRSTTNAPPVADKSATRRLRTSVTALTIGGLVATGLLVWHRSADTVAPTASNAAALVSNADYVAPAACSGCHSEIWKTFLETGMGRSLHRTKPGTERTLVGPSEPFHHKASDRYYEHVERNGRYYQRRYQKDTQGNEVNVLEKEIHFVMGSGNHARTFLNRSPSGKLVQLPLGWYSEGGGHWAMSPGYDRPNHDGFQRVISFDCMFCHNGFPDLQIGRDRPGMRPLFPGAIPEGIDCQRCHGPGSAHVEAATSGNQDAESVIASIVNPSRLPTERQADVCFQCHLETTSRPLPNIVHRYGRGYFSFRPGERLSDYAIVFDHAAGTGWDDKFEINHSAYRLMQSACYVESGGALTCTKCHDPHEPSGTPQAFAQYDAACRRCHETQLGSLTSEHTHVSESGCTGCHMPKRRTDDVVHAVMTDHRIQASPPKGLLQPKPERSTLAETAYRGDVSLFYPRSMPGPESELYKAVAQTAQGSNLAEGIRRLEAAINARQPAEAGFYFELAAALEKSGRLEEAVQWFERALAREPGHVLAHIRLGSVLSRLARHEQAEAVLQHAASIDPTDPRIPKERGMNFARQGLFAQAADATRTGIGLDPDLPELHNNLGGALAEMGRLDDAEAALHNAVRLQPDLADARFNLGSIMATRGNHAGAVAEWSEALRVDPEYVTARYNLAVLLARGGNTAAALAHLDAAIKTDPEFDQARALRDRLRGTSKRAVP